MAKYLDADEFYAEILKWKDSSADPDERVPSEKLGTMFITLADHIIRGPSFHRYPFEMKNDMKGYAMLKCIKGLKTFDTTRGAKSAFSYFTRVVWVAFITEINKHYNHQNTVRMLEKDYLQTVDPRAIDTHVRDQRLNQIKAFEDDLPESARAKLKEQDRKHREWQQTLKRNASRYKTPNI